MKSNFIQRAITGIIFVGILVGCILGGPISFSLLFALITALTIHEFGTIVSKQQDVEINKPICMLAGVFLFFGFAYLGVMPGQNEILIPYLFLIIYLLVSELYLKRKPVEQLGIYHDEPGLHRLVVFHAECTGLSFYWQ